MILDGTGHDLQIHAAGAATTTEPEFVISYADIGAAFTPDITSGVLTGATIVDALTGVASNQRMIKNISICNLDTVPSIITVLFDDATNARTIMNAVSLAVGQTLYWSLETGWRIQPEPEQNVTTGVWTPTVDFETTGDFVPTYTFQEGRWTRFANNLVYYEALVVWDSNAFTTPTGKLSIDNLPFTAELDAALFFQLVSSMSTANMVYNAADVDVVGLIEDNTTDLFVFTTRSAATLNASSTTNFPASTNGLQIRVSGTYRIAV